jgi:hypothetical protein
MAVDVPLIDFHKPKEIEMTSSGMMKRIAEASPRFKARMAGVFFFPIMLTAAFTELVVRGRLSSAADIVEVSSMLAVTLLLYAILTPEQGPLFARGVPQPRGTNL